MGTSTTGAICVGCPLKKNGADESRSIFGSLDPPHLGGTCVTHVWWKYVWIILVCVDLIAD
jgi:hypothetical protein